MKKRIVSLLCVLALCLGLLPVAALAADTNTVYVGGVALAGSSDSIVYATTNENGEVITEGATADNYNIKWDGSTLTLCGATIKKELYASNIPLSDIAGAAIGVINQSGDAGLTVQLEGNNKIEGVSTGIRVRSSGGNTALNIKGHGSLVVNSNFPTIQVISIGSNAALSIENAKVTATSSYSNVVTVESNSSENSTLTVNGGGLIATAQSNNVSGIRFRGTGETGGSPTVTVSNNAIVRANGSAGGITSDSSTGVQYGTGSNSTGGIVWNGSNGTVYGSVTLQEDITIGEGESLTIGDGASLNTGSHEVIVDGGTLTGGDNITGKVKYAPTITTESLPDGEVGTAYSQTLTATGDTPITWSVSGTLPAGLSLDAATGIISGTPTTEKTSTFTVTATNDSSSDSKEYTLTIKAVPVTGVALDKTELALFTGESETLTATVEPGNATNQNVTWSSDKPEVATVEDGKVTAVAAGEATITVTTADGGKQATCQVKVTQSTYSISADTQALDFGSACPGYERPAAKTVTVTNTGNRSLALTQPASTNNFEVGTLSKTELAAGETATFTVQPKAGLAAGAYSETIVVSASNNVTLTIPASFTVKHELEKVAAKAPTCTEAGNKEYWGCKVCGKYFDTDGKTEITRESTVIPAAGHKYENGKCTVCGAADPNFRPTPAPTATPAPTSTPLPYYILHFNTMGGYPLADVTFGEGAPVELWPYNPTRPGYLFMGWYEDEALTKPVSVVVLMRETTVYAKWAVDPAAQTSGSGTGSSSGSGSGSGTKATATPSPTAKPTATPAPTPTVTPTPTATPESTPAVTPAPDETGDKGGFPVLPVALGAGAILAGIVAVVILRRRV